MPTPPSLGPFVEASVRFVRLFIQPVVYDGLFLPYEPHFGGGVRRSFDDFGLHSRSRNDVGLVRIENIYSPFLNARRLDLFILVFWLKHLHSMKKHLVL